MDKKVNFERELELLFVDHIREEKRDKEFINISSQLKLYCDQEYIKQLIMQRDLFKLDEYITQFTSLQNEQDQMVLKLIREINFFISCKQADFKAAVQSMKRIQLLPNSIVTKQYLTRLSNLFFDDDLIAKNELNYDGYDNYIITNLFNCIMNEIEKGSTIKEYMKFPEIQKGTLKKLVSNGVRYDHIKICQGSVDDKIGLVSLIKPEHMHLEKVSTVIRKGNKFSDWKFIDVQLKSNEISCLYVKDTRVYIGFKTGNFTCIDFESGEVLFDIKENSPVTLVSVLSTYIVYYNGSQVKVLCIGYCLSILAIIPATNVKSISIINGTTEVAIVDSKGVKVYQFANKNVIYENEGAIGVIPSQVQGEVVVVYPTLLHKLKTCLGKPNKVTKEQQLSILVDCVIDENVMISNDNRYIVIPNEKIRKIYSRKSSAPILAGNDTNVFVYSQGNIQVIEIETQQIKQQISCEHIQKMSADNCLAVCTFDNSTQLRVFYREFNVIPINWNSNTIKEPVNIQFEVMCNEQTPSSNCMTQVAPVTPITYSKLEPIKRKPDEDIPIKNKIIFTEQTVKPDIPSTISKCDITNFWKVKGNIKMFTISNEGKHLMIQTTKDIFYLFKKVDGKTYISSFPKDKKVLDFSGEKQFHNVRGVVTRTGSYIVISLGSCCELYKCSSALRVSQFGQQNKTNDGYITCLELFPFDCNSVLIGSSNGFVKVYRANRQFELISLSTCLNEPIHSFVFLPSTSADEDVLFFVITKTGFMQLVQYNKKTSPYDTMKCLDVSLSLKVTEVKSVFIGNNGKYLYVVSREMLHKIDRTNMSYEKMDIPNNIISAAISAKSDMFFFVTSQGLLLKMSSSKWGVLESVIVPEGYNLEFTYVIPYEDYFLVSTNKGEILKIRV
ncbi:hypothetical protein EHI8A_011630 [Entamoeba histolytica HM-1:IMSS-B]|uniref:Uncharacterized protein n=6 Tax=Entamoeba histolytica TaxID=5759 RepID=C4LUU2_ENTH1|nr:hypothetical protein EHI_178780 [Entamoeba histolytica HM-1:IMSS]EMD49056.1 Hypothetical protein EHI5A_008330 [Entamoeba histolytica KU27]EMH72754.1 hypothetical protein EHI8A_011630 [Entamoeba histolytica HM-1:IMSS-B]EMS17418.1 hypothetical protein KM1_037030 [Entamoeba histolytica HM-3:IMSS]ENY61456.1 hypothetical protein EHI7A_015230 [Entamoeba histolytica HM-1:IMSS-A]GAT92402.1 hypothetical protein CL6EHI_178780 [Entamoeba histolytica]|eukprot:XP_656246.1 hypothetical protein EHI_178780 [Entamoeba histolytica HM-1:IMSS]